MITVLYLVLMCMLIGVSIVIFFWGIRWLIRTIKNNGIKGIISTKDIKVIWVVCAVALLFFWFFVWFVLVFQVH